MLGGRPEVVVSSVSVAEDGEKEKLSYDAPLRRCESSKPLSEHEEFVQLQQTVSTIQQCLHKMHKEIDELYSSKL